MKELTRYCRKYNVGFFKDNQLKEERDNEEKLPGDSKIKM